MTQKTNTPNCKMHDLLVTYLYGETTPEDSLHFESHLVDCVSCKQELSAFESVRESLQLWQLEEAPSLRIAVAQSVQPKRSLMAVLKELFMVMPVWAKGLGAIATAMLILAVMGTNIQIGKGGFSFSADILRKNQPTAPTAIQPDLPQVATTKVDPAIVEQIRTNLLAEVKKEIAEISLSERAQREEFKTQLVNFQTQLKDMRAADVLKIAARVQEHNSKLRAIERDLDRREGFGLSDILFSEANPPRPNSRPGSDD
jgi:hypothetical protein